MESSIEKSKESSTEKYLKSLTLRELKIICKEYKIKINQRKEPLIQNIIKVKEKESPQFILEKNKKQIEDEKNKEKKSRKTNQEIKNIEKKTFHSLVQNRDLGDFNGLPKNVFQYVLSFLNEWDIVKFSITNKLMRKLCLNPYITRKTMKKINLIRDHYFLFIPTTLGEYLGLDSRFKVNKKFYILTRTLYKYMICYLFRKEIKIKRVPQQQGNINIQLPIKQRRVGYQLYMKQKFYDRLVKDNIKLPNSLQNMSNHPSSISGFIERIATSFSNKQLHSMEWYIDMDLAFYIYEQENKYEVLFEELIK